MKRWTKGKIREKLPLLERWGVRFFGGAVLSCATVFGGHAPFALGFVAASGARFDGLFAAFGAILGSVLFMDFPPRLRLVASAVLIFSATMAFYDAAFYKKRYVRSVIAAALSAAVEFAYLFSGSPTGREVLGCLGAVGLIGVSETMYTRFFKGKVGKEDRILWFFMLISLLLCGSELRVWGVFSPVRMMMLLLVLYCAERSGSGVGAAAGFAAGLLLDASMDGTGLVTTALLTLFGLISSLLGQKNRFLCAAAIFAAEACFILPYGAGEAGGLIAESLLALTLYFFLPKGARRGKRLQAQENAGDKLCRQLTDLSTAFREVYDMLADRNGEEEDPAVIFDRSAESVCRSCTLCSLCWKEDYISTFNAFNDATPILLERGEAQGRDFPIHFSSRCIRFPQLLAAINAELTAYLVRTGYRRRLAESQKHLRRQYAQISELFRTTAASVGKNAIPAAACSSRSLLASIASAPKTGAQVSGDTAESFTLENGMSYLVLSDGAGTGEEARRESALAVRLVRHFLHSGIDVSSALRTLNEAFNLKGDQGGAFATVDLAEVDAARGEVAFYKFGAAPSYIKRGIEIRRVTGSCLPAGLHTGECPPDAQRTALGAEEYVVLVSDGVADLLCDEWLMDLLSLWQGEDPQELADLILREARRRGGGEDDCTVMAARLETGAKAV